MNSQTEALGERYRRFAEHECGDYSPFYARLARYVSASESILSFIGKQMDPQPNLFFASVQYLTGAEEMPADGPELEQFVRAKEGEIARLMRTRRTQTNEVGRCSALLPLLPADRPIALIEVGASAGLCLNCDLYSYRYGDRVFGPPESPVVIDCELLGSNPVPIPGEMPQIVWRRGLDLAPVDVTNEDATRWLLACVWADHSDRRRRLSQAIDLAREDPPGVSIGDLIEGLPRLIDEAPRAATLVVFHSAVMPYIDEARRVGFAQVLEQESTKRPIVWISLEGPGVFPELETQVSVNGESGKFRLGRADVGSDEGLLLRALVHPHGADLRWLS